MKYTQSIFRNVSDFMAMVRQPAQVMGTSVDASRDSWGGGSMANALAMVDTGWSGRPDLGAMAKAMAIQGNAPAHSTRHAVSGAFIDMGEYLSGMPECMIDFIEEPAPRIIKLGVNLVASGANNPEAFKRRGAVVLAVVESLQAAGYGVEVTVYMLASASGTSWVNLDAFILKRADQPLDMDSLAFWTCHPSAFRRIWFALCERKSSDFRSAFGVYRQGGYGMPATLRNVPQAKEELALDLEIDIVPQSMDDAKKLYEKIMEPFINE